MKNFIWIVIEGIDGSGKTTISKELTKEFCQIDKTKTFMITEPYQKLEDRWLHEYPEILKIQNLSNIRPIVSDKLRSEKDMDNKSKYHLFLTDRMILLDSLKTLNPGGVVISDRSYISSLAYQSVLLNRDIELILLDTESIFRNIFDIRPDFIFYLRIPPEISMGRIDKPDNLDIVFKKRHQEIYEKYEYLFSNDAENLLSLDRRLAIDDVKIHNIDATLSINKIMKNIKDILGINNQDQPDNGGK